MKSLLHSRKFLIAVCDAVFSIAAMVITSALTDKIELRVLVLGILATLQPVFIAVINGIAVEDAANAAAFAVSDAAAIAASAPSSVDPAGDTPFVSAVGLGSGSDVNPSAPLPPIQEIPQIGG